MGNNKEDKQQVFLGGECKTDWRDDVIEEFKDTLNLIDPVDEDWDASQNIYTELADMLLSDEVVFYRGGEGTEKEKEFLEKLDKDYEEFGDLDELDEHLEEVSEEVNTIKAAINIPLEIGDDILTGRFKNRKQKVKSIGEDSKNQPTVNGKPLLTLRIPELMEDVKSIQSILKTADYEHGCAMCPIPNELRRIILKEIAPKIDREDLAEDKNETLNGVETDSHITLLYGIDPSPKVIQQIKEYFVKPITIKSSNKIEYFDNDNSVAIIPVESPDLTKLHDILKETLDNKDTYDEYKPHITIAYLDSGARLDSDKIESFEWEISKLIVSKPDGEVEDIYLKEAEPVKEAVELVSTIKKAFDQKGYADGTPKEIFDNNRESFWGNLGDNYDIGSFNYVTKDYYNIPRMDKRKEDMLGLYPQETAIDETIEDKSEQADEAGSVPIDDDIKGRNYEDYVTQTIESAKKGFYETKRSTNKVPSSS